MSSRITHLLLLAGALLPLTFFHSTLPAQTVTLSTFATNFTSLTTLIPVSDGTGRLIAADQIGIAHVLSQQGEVSATPLLDVRPQLVKLNAGFDERGLLGIALHPQFTKNGRLFACYNVPLRQGVDTNWNCTLRISEFKVPHRDTLVADPGSERIILEWDKPHFNHNGGCIVFGPDGHLYIGSGDGGAANGIGLGHSPISNGQDLNTLLGKILRIDVDHQQPYAIPSDNPFAQGPGKPEIYAYGFRNPWRLSFDRAGTHELFAADVGQTLYEEVNIVTQGGNYGWFVKEGRICFDPQNPKTPRAQCADKDAAGKAFIDPVIEYKNANGFRKDTDAFGISITGGYVYRGKAIPSLQGKYVFGDWSKNWALPQGVFLVATRPADGKGSWSVSSRKIQVAGEPAWKWYITAFGEDSEGELYVLTNGYNSLQGKTGRIFKLTAAD